MGGALLARWQHTHPAGIRNFFVIEPVHPHADTPQTTWLASLDALPGEAAPDVVVFAVKPQMLPLLLPEYFERFRETQPLFLSIAAGKKLAFFTAQLGEHARVVRAMPNTAALVGQAVTAMCATASVPASGKALATQLMQAVGETLWLDDEAQMDIVTALSGSGPAYVFLFLDALAAAAEEAGLPYETARLLAVKTVLGSAALAAAGADSFEKLRQNVTSPGGTTEAALEVLMKNDAFSRLVKDAVRRAMERSRELAL